MTQLLLNLRTVLEAQTKCLSNCPRTLLREGMWNFSINWWKHSCFLAVSKENKAVCLYVCALKRQLIYLTTEQGCLYLGIILISTDSWKSLCSPRVWQGSTQSKLSNYGCQVSSAWKKHTKSWQRWLWRWQSPRWKLLRRTIYFPKSLLFCITWSKYFIHIMLSSSCRQVVYYCGIMLLFTRCPQAQFPSTRSQILYLSSWSNSPPVLYQTKNKPRQRKR